MFKFIGQFADRYRIPLLVGWIAAAILITLLAPNLDDVVSNDQSDFLPADAPSQIGFELITEHFPDQAQNSNIVVVFDAGAGNQVLTPENTTYIHEFSLWLIGEGHPAGIQSVQSPTFSPDLASALTSADEQITIISIALDTSDQDVHGVILEAIGTQVEDAPVTLDVYRTGNAAIFTEFDDTLTRSVDRTIFVTITLVIVMLLLIYRSPISPFIPLTVVTIAFMIARGIVAWLGESVFTISGTASMLLIVVMYGAGTDYCLFLISRFREEMANGNETRPAVRSTVHRVGESISSSAGTTATGFLALSMAQLGLFNTTGPTLAIGVVVSLIAGLTLTPAFLGLLGQRTFWPGQAKQRSSGAFYRRTSQLVSSRPLLTIIVIILIMGPFALYGINYERNFDFLVDMPDDSESVEGFRILEEHIGAGELQPMSAVAVLTSEDTLSEASAITHDLEGIDGVASVRTINQPFGANHPTANLIRVDTQLMALASVLAPAEDSGAELTDEQIAFMQDLMQDIPVYLTTLAEINPALAETEVYDTILRELSVENSAEINTSLIATHLMTLSERATHDYLLVSDLPPTIQQIFGGEATAGLLASYVNPNTNALRFEIVFTKAPYSPASLDAVADVNDVLSRYADDYGVAGTSASNADLREIMGEDTQLTFTLVLVGIFIVLLVMLRSVVAPIYLIGTIILSYTATLGITRLASSVLWGTDKLTWWVPFFMFVFLVALGIDYSIFLFGRIKEEVRRVGIEDGIHNAVQSTGSIITSAGIIVAGTFGAMMTGEILGLAQIGFAVSVGILIDTFIVRTILDPALASFFGKWTWWPGGVPFLEIPQDSVDEESGIKPRQIPEFGGTD